MLAIEIDQLIKEYKSGVRALDGLCLTVKCGEIFSLLGPNGAGKSSLIHILTTYYKATSGNVTILGKDLCKEPDLIRTQIACAAQQISIDTHLSLRENMWFQSRLYQVAAPAAKERIDALIACFELSEYLKYPVDSYSGGVKRRLDIAMHMVSFPKILFLDEPTVGMDVDSRKAMWEMLLKIRREYGTTIFLTTHYLEEADQLSDSICIMKEGKVRALGTPEDLRSYTRKNMLRITFPSTVQAQKCENILRHTGLVQFIRMEDCTIFAGVPDRKAAFVAVNKWLLDHQIEFNAIEILEPSLEDVFLVLTRSGENETEEFLC